MAEKVSSLGFLSPHRPQNHRRCAPFRPACNAPLHTCRSSSSPVDTSQHIDRRALLLGTSAFAAALALESSAQAEGSTHSHTQARHAGPLAAFLRHQYGLQSKNIPRHVCQDLYRIHQPLRMNAHAEEVGGDIKTFWGLARPPTSYGAYAGGDQKNAKCASQVL